MSDQEQMASETVDTKSDDDFSEEEVFAEAAAEAKSAKDDDEDESDKDDPKEAEPSKKVVKEESTREEKEPEKKPTALEELDQLSEETPAAQPKEQEPERPERKPEKPTGVMFELLKSAKNEDLLPDGDIEIGGENVNLKTFAEEFPELQKPLMAMTASVVEKTVVPIMRAVHEQLTVAQAKIQELSFWNQLNNTNPEATQIARSEEFQSWLEKQPDKVKQAAGVWDVKKAALVIRAYQETKQHDQAAKEAKKKKDDLHEGTIKSKKAVSAAGSDDDGQDEESIFKRYAAQRAKQDR